MYYNIILNIQTYAKIINFIFYDISGAKCDLPPLNETKVNFLRF